MMRRSGDTICLTLRFPDQIPAPEIGCHRSSLDVESNLKFEHPEHLSRPS